MIDVEPLNTALSDVAMRSELDEDVNLVVDPTLEEGEIAHAETSNPRRLVDPKILR